MFWRKQSFPQPNVEKNSFCPVKSMLGEILRKFGTDLDFDKNLKLFAFLKKIIKI